MWTLDYSYLAAGTYNTVERGRGGGGGILYQDGEISNKSYLSSSDSNYEIMKVNMKLF